MSRVLIIAEAANPEWVSVPLTGWSTYEALTKLGEMHLVTQIRNRDAIRRAGLTEGSDFTAINSERISRPFCRIRELVRGGKGRGWTTATAFNTLSYYYFEHLVWKQFGARIKSGEYDIVHRITPLSPTTPSLIAARCRRAGVPFVLGPLNGGLPWPKQFRAARWQEKEWMSYVRGAHKLLPGYRSTRRYASAILIGSIDTWRQMPVRYHDKCCYVVDPAIDTSRFSRRRQRQARRPIRAIFVGRLVPYKGADMLIEAAVPLVQRGDLTVDVIGDGPQMGELRAMVDRAGVAEGVRLHGWVKHTAVQDFMVEADVFVFPSIREFGGGVVLEAMAVGLVPIVVDYGGPAEYVTPRCGHLVPLSIRGSIVEELRSVLGELVSNPSEIEKRAVCAARRARKWFTWEAKASQIMEAYRWVLGERPDKPDFGMPLPDPPRRRADSSRASSVVARQRH